MSKPRIAIPTPTSFDQEYNERCWPQYAQAIEHEGGVPVEVPLTATPAEIADLVTTCQAVLLPGSPADVNPQKYGADREPETAPPDLARENVDELLLQDAHNLGKPIFGICYGLQSLNTWRGGTLQQHLSSESVDHAAGPEIIQAHAVDIDTDSFLGSVYGAASSTEPSTFVVNSSHHQAVAQPGDHLQPVARSSDDGTIEALEQVRTAHSAYYQFVLGVQWHPERLFASDMPSRALFSRFVGEARSWTPRAITTSVASH